MTYVPDHADVIWIDLDPQVGREQRGRRPALVLSHSNYNGRVNLAVCCPITSHAKGYPFEIPIPPNLPLTGVILVDHIKCLDWKERKATFSCKMPSQTILLVVRRLNTLIRPIAELPEG